MAIITRNELEGKFKNNAIPTQGDFKDLIDSSLNRKDDCFFGKWKKNYKYKNGDVVLYGKSLYKLVLTDDEVDCPPEGEEAPSETSTEEGTGSTQQVFDASKRGRETTNESHSDDPATLCSEKPPSQDPRWCLLEFQVEDDDWQVLDIDGVCVLTPKKESLIGIGTGESLPSGAVEIIESDKGKIILMPEDEIHPAIQIENNQERKGVIQVSSTYVEHIAKTPSGFAFFKENENLQTAKQEAPRSTKEKTEPILVINADESGNPRIGIGTTTPIASLDARLEGKGQILLQPREKSDPEIVLLNLDPECYENYLTTSIGEKSATFTTDAEEGFKFKKGEEYSLYKTREKMKGKAADLPPEIENPTLMTILPDGKVGIGTETPTTHLEVKHETKGTFQMSFEKTNPAFSIINRRPNPSNFLSVGTDNNFGILMTDSEKGFKFKKSDTGTKGNGTPDINYGSDLMMLTPDQKLGIGIYPTYHLDVNGKTRTNGVYLETDKTKVDVVSSFADQLKSEERTAIEKISELTPVIFKWNEKTNCANDGNHLGFLAHEVADNFPETVKTHADGTQSVAYANLVAALVEAMKEQQNQIEDLRKRVQKLEMKKY